MSVPELKTLEAFLAVTKSEQVLELVSDDLQKLLQMAETHKSWLYTQMLDKTKEVCQLTQKLNGKLRHYEKTVPDVMNIRKLVGMTARSISVSIHNTKNRTDLALAIMRMAKEEFSDVPELGTVLLRDEVNLNTQYNALVRAGRLSGGILYKADSAKTLRIRAETAKKSKLAKQTIENYTKAAALEDSQSKLALGMLYLTGELTDKDEKLALEWIGKAVADGYTPAIVELSKCYENGVGVPQDADISLQLLKAAASAGDADIANQIGLHYLRGTGVAKDIAQAAVWIRKAAENGSVDGMWNLGTLYENGLGVPRDAEQALNWYGKAGNKGHGEAAFMAGLLCQRKGDTAAAKGHFIRSAKAGSIHGCREAARLLSQSGSASDKADALNWRKKVIELGSTEAGDYVELALALKERGSDADLTEAVKQLQTAQGKGYAQAAIHLQQVQQLQAARALAAKAKKKKKAIRTLIALASVVVLVFIGTVVCFFAGKSALNSGDYQKADTLLTFGGFYDQEVRAEAQFRLGAQLLEQEDFTKAFNLLEQSGRTDTPEYCYADAMRLLIGGPSAELPIQQLLDLAEERLEDAGKLGQSPEYLKILKLIQDQRYAQALLLAQELNPDQTGAMVIGRWTTLISSLDITDSSDVYLRKLCLEAWRTGRTEAPEDEDIEKIVNGFGDSVDGWPSSEVEKVSNLASLRKACGKPSDGKVLIVRASHPYGTDGLDYGIDKELMALLSVELIPGSLAEVRYLMILEYDYQDSPTGDYGEYFVQTQGLQEIAQVTVIDLKSNKTIYDSGIVVGPDSPQSFSYSGYVPPSYKSGGSPNMAKYVIAGLDKLLKAIS